MSNAPRQAEGSLEPYRQPDPWDAAGAADLACFSQKRILLSQRCPIEAEAALRRICQKRLDLSNGYWKDIFDEVVTRRLLEYDPFLRKTSSQTSFTHMLIQQPLLVPRTIPIDIEEAIISSWPAVRSREW